jgi:hypothetical protein
MYRIVLACASLVIVTVTIGCGSSDSGGGTGSMSDAGAAVERENTAAVVAPAEGGAADQNAAPPADTQPAAAANLPAATASPLMAAPTRAPVAVDPSLASKRGFDLEDWSNEMAYVLIKADAAKAADALAAAWQGKVVKDVFGKELSEERGHGLIYQLKGHPWSIFACDNSDLEKLTPVLSRDADVLVFWQSDFNGWAGVELYRGGEEVEAVHWGGVEEKLGEDANASKWHAEGKFNRTYEDITMTDSFLFRSKLRKMTPEELGKGDAVVDEFFVKHDAYLPDADQMPWQDWDSKLITSPLGAGAFAGVHGIELAP